LATTAYSAPDPGPDPVPVWCSAVSTHTCRAPGTRSRHTACAWLTAGSTDPSNRRKPARPRSYGGHNPSCPARNNVANGSLNNVYAPSHGYRVATARAYATNAGAKSGPRNPSLNQSG
jgi:hypothetical protein